MSSFVINREPRTRFGTIVVLSSAHLLLWSVQGALPAVFPPLARQRALSAAEYSSVFGLFGIARLLLSCLDNELLSLTRPKFYLVNGLFLLGGTTILTGVLQWCPPGVQFYLLSFLLQSLGGMAVAFISNISLLVLDLTFPTNALFYVTVLERFSLVGLVSGPIFALFAMAERYALPFLVVGIFLLATSAFALLCVEDERPAFEWCSPEDGRDLFRIRLVKCAQLISFVNSAADAFVLISLTGHALAFNLGGDGQASALYLLYYVCYASATYLVKSVTNSTVARRDICKHAELLWCSVGCLTSAFGFLALGPANFISITPTTFLLGFALVLRGFGCGCLSSGAFVVILRAARKMLRLPYDTQTYALVRRMTSLPANAGYVFGAFMSCVIGQDTSLTQTTCSVYFVLFLLMCCICWVCHMGARRQMTLSAEETPLCDCSVRLDSAVPSSPTDLFPSDEDWQWLIQKRDDDDRNFMQPSL